MRSDQGCHRPDNEDCIRYVYPEPSGRKADRGILVLVADGMGGHAAGEVASAMAVHLVARAYYRDRSEPHRALKQAFREANRVIYRVAQQRADYRGMGTTCTGLVLRGGVAYAAHVGDSRLYLVRRGAIYLMTEDHSMAMHMVRQGLMSSDDARRHTARAVLLRALGTRAHVDIATWAQPFPVQANDRFILCTDGLSDLVDEAQIKHVVMAYPPTVACERLVAMAKRHGGYDNISVGVVWIVVAPSTVRSKNMCGAETGRATR